MQIRFVKRAALTPAQSSEQQQSAAQPTAPLPHAPAPTPAITGPQQAAPPIPIGGERLPDLVINGVLSGMALWQGNHVPGDELTQATVSNAQIYIQKTTGWWQFYVQGGTYDIPALGTLYLRPVKPISHLYGPIPVAYVKFVAGKNTFILVGAPRCLRQ